MPAERRQNPDKLMLRLPDGMRETIKEAAAQNRRSMNAEIVFHLERIFRDADPQATEA